MQPACSQRGKKVQSDGVSQTDSGDTASQDALLDESHPPDGTGPDGKDLHQDANDVPDLLDLVDASPDVHNPDIDVPDISDVSDSHVPDVLPDVVPDVPDAAGDVAVDVVPDVTPEPIPFLLEGFSAACGVMQSVDYRVTFRMAPFGLAVTQESKNESYSIRPVSNFKTSN